MILQSLVGILIGFAGLVLIHNLKRRFFLIAYGIDIDEWGIK